MVKILLIMVILIFSFGCGEVTELEPDEVVKALGH